MLIALQKSQYLENVKLFRYRIFMAYYWDIILYVVRTYNLY